MGQPFCDDDDFSYVFLVGYVHDTIGGRIPSELYYTAVWSWDCGLVYWHVTREDRNWNWEALFTKCGQDSVGRALSTLNDWLLDFFAVTRILEI